ncbi:MAG: c-type cytochrome [Candidatus Thiodiazotropha sp. (ex Lucinoma borealis)]|nr:c-type cytochrome [Candidatus Thiodiazotropha sp. (ex Lucinoma borealis)]MCU7868590.1 c-type cytochrome [Candidatus Thiodiazotropha sp. (ex Lucinoma borealis)]
MGTSSGPFDDKVQKLDIGRRIYNFYCYFCHGYTGDAKTLAARFLDPPPRNFMTADPNVIDHERAITAVREGRYGTAMKPFAGVLSNDEIEAVVNYVRHNFMQNHAPNTLYHTEENGWPAHERFLDSFPFATGEISLDAPAAFLTDVQRRGLKLYFTSCISCHDRSQVDIARVSWEPVALSYPRTSFLPGDSLLPPDALSGATSFAQHDFPLAIKDLTQKERAGEKIYQSNCAFCHSADGTGKNWIGTFLEPHPRDLTDTDFMSEMSRERMREVIRNGLPGTSMPAWKHVLVTAEIEALVAYVHRAFHPLSDGESD